MSPLETKVRALFDAYGKGTDGAFDNPPRDDMSGLIDAFASFVVESSPKGVQGRANDASFRTGLPKGLARYRDLGGRHMTIKGLNVTQLDPLHAIADVDWDFAYASKSGQSGHITFTNLYLVSIASGAAKIFAYITPDEDEALRDHGLL